MKFLLFAFAAILFAACKSDDDTDDDDQGNNDPEVITEVRLNFEDTEGTISPFSVSYLDPDGPGGEAPEIQEINLDNGYAYSVSLGIYGPNGDDLTSEILEEGEEHQFFYELDEVTESVLSITYNDEDANEKPIGLNSIWGTLGTSSGTESVTIVLRHEPNKEAPGASQGELSDEVGGETDVEVTFNVNIQ